MPRSTGISPAAGLIWLKRLSNERKVRESNVLSRDMKPLVLRWHHLTQAGGIVNDFACFALENFFTT